MSKFKNWAKKTWSKVNKKTVVNIVGATISWITKGTINKNTVFGIAGTILGLSSYFGPTEIRSDVAAANETIKQLQEQIAADSVTISAARWYLEDIK